MSANTITPGQLAELASAGTPIELIDVRTPVEFREVHVDFARNVPLDQFDAGTIAAERGNTAQPLYVICHAGNRSLQACAKLAAAGYTNVVNVEGGTQAWNRAGLPVVRGKKAVSLERQVRIVTGSLVLIGVGVGVLITPYAFGLVGFVGAGLVFAGITDSCCMGMILARMPWNQVTPALAGSQLKCN